MNRFLPFFFFFALPSTLHSQNFTGQWKGEFIDNSVADNNWGGEKCDYVLDLETKGNRISGYSYTYFTENGKKYFTICKLEGTVDVKQKFVEIREIERTKTNVPPSIHNCFQRHRLTYFKKGNSESLSGDWQPMPNQQGDCGFGLTKLNRRLLEKNFTANRSSTTANARSLPARQEKASGQPAIVDNNSVAIAVPKTKKAIPNSVSAVELDNSSNAVIKEEEIPLSNPDVKPAETQKHDFVLPNYSKRQGTLMRKLEVHNTNLKIQLFDNGEVDGDSVSLFLNNNLILSHRRLSEKGIPFTVNLDEDISENILEMYAENLGAISPNTALMIINDGNQRYEVRISSDFSKSGIIKFILRN